MATSVVNIVFCRGDNRTCDCERFWPKKDDEGHCLKCSHGISKYPDADLRDVAAVHPSSESLLLTYPSTENTPWEIFKNITRTSGMADPDSLLMQAAREEALSMLTVAKQSGYHKLAKGPTPVTQKAQHFMLDLWECSHVGLTDTRKLPSTPATYGSVPDHVYETWNTEPIILRSDTDDSVKDDAVSLLSNSVSALVVLPRTPKKGHCSGKKRIVFSSPESESSVQRHAMKKMKDATAPEIMSLSSMPGLVVEAVLSPPPKVVIVDEDDVLFRGCVHNVLPKHNPWVKKFHSLPSLDLTRIM
ncbi:hypothetical protein HD554DRAFT_2042679 [Boletus coccyginus]|nr:hypothetical protein HD554DRAFT_2042679 [Boletus coccyginus]